jgi:endonuclease/exonuclease/phosphatase family metal-dependent hydrolase
MSFHFHPAIQVEEERYGDAILTSLPMRLVQAERLPGNPLLEPRGAIWVAVNTVEGELQIINTHLGLVAHERLIQAKTLLGPRWVSHPTCRDPLILLGDFNAVRRSRAYGLLSSKLRDAQLELHRRPRRTFPARMPMLRIDHIFCSPSVEVLNVAAPRTGLGRVASDHLPLVMNFRVARGGATPGRETQKPLALA